MFLIPSLYNKIFIFDLSNQILEGSIFSTVVKNWVVWKVLKIVQNENFIMQRGYREHFCFYEIFLLSSQILDFTLWTKSTVVEFSNGQIDRIFPRSVLRPLYVYLSFGMLKTTVLIHEGSTLPLPNREVDHPTQNFHSSPRDDSDTSKTAASSLPVFFRV